MKPSERRRARQYAVQAVYQWQLSNTPMREIEAQFLSNQIKKKLDLDYFKELIHAVYQHHAELDNHMTPFLNRSIRDLDPVELSILRLSIYELAHRLDVPYQVVINEALELTKTFGSIEGYKFVNGILDKIAKKIRIPEQKKAT